MNIKTEHLRRFPNHRIFIETGSFHGSGIQTALESGVYSKIHSIEVDEQFHTECTTRFVGVPTVELHLGCSTDVLPDILRRYEFTMPGLVFWLDAHGAWTPGKKFTNTSPLLDELSIIKRHACPNSVIFIDDRRHFKYMKASEELVYTALFEINPVYTIELLDGYDVNIPADIVMAFKKDGL